MKIGATGSGLMASCNAGAVSSDLWFKWNSLQASNYTFRICDADYDVVLALWDNCNGNPLGCSDQDGCGQDSFNSVDVTLDVAGSGVLVQIDGLAHLLPLLRYLGGHTPLVLVA